MCPPEYRHRPWRSVISSALHVIEEGLTPRVLERTGRHQEALRDNELAMVLTLKLVDPPADFAEQPCKVFDENGGTIGRRPDNTWTLSDQRISGTHATITFQHGVYSIIDASTNGVFVENGLTRLPLGRPHGLRSGDMLTIGPFTVRVSVTSTTDNEDATLVDPQVLARPALSAALDKASTPRVADFRHDPSNQATRLPREGTFLKTLVVTDLVASTRMTEELGDTRASDIFWRQDRLARDLLAQHNGTEIDKTDGFLLFFDRPIEAVSFSMAYHRALSELSDEIGVEVATRVAIHLGEVVVRHNTAHDIARGANSVEVEGLAKPFTARLMGLAVGKQTLLSRSAFDVAQRAAVGMPSPHGQLGWMTHGDYLLKGVEESVEVFEVGIIGVGPLVPPPDSEKARRSPGFHPDED